MVLDDLIMTLTGDAWPECANVSMTEFKLIPFQNTAISRNGIAELIERQTTFLHRTTATSVIDMGDGSELFATTSDGEEQSDGTIRDWAMEAKTADAIYIFHSVEPGRHGKCYFPYEKHR